MAKRVIIQGYRGAFHEIAARNYFEDQEIEIVAADSFPELVHELESDQDRLVGMMAIENTLYGSLLANYKLLRRANLTIVGEVYLRVAQQLLALPGTQLDDLREVSSHPVAIAQCKDFFKDYSNIDLVESVDTALSAKSVSESGDKRKGAIASKLAGDLYGLEVISDNIETNKKNFTRFLVLEKLNDQTVQQNANKVSLVFRTGHQVGSLHKVLGILAAYNLNMTKIHSAPIVGEDWKYKFFVDFELEGLVGYQHAIEAIRPLVEELKILGVYQKGKHYAD